jgi:hypothetical protein
VIAPQIGLQIPIVQAPQVAPPDPVLQAIAQLSTTVQGLVTRVTGLEGSHNVAPPVHAMAAVHAANALGNLPDRDLDASLDNHAADEGEGGDNARVTAKVLRDNETLQRNVSARLHELSSNPLEQFTDACLAVKQGKKSGRTKTVHDVIVNDVEWPHYHVHRTSNEKSVTYDDLSLPEFVLGTLKSIVLTETMSTMAEIKINHLSDLMADAEDFQWPVLRQYHGTILQDLEMNRYSWLDQDMFQKRKLKHVARAEAVARRPARQSQSYSLPKPFAQSSAPSYDRQQPTVHAICKAYNLGECNAPSPHSSPDGLVRHSCGFCKRTIQRHFGHTEKTCRRKNEGQSNKEVPKNV